MTVTGSCHCGAMQIAVPAAPEFLTQCGCSICSRLGILWAYYPVAEVSVTGESDGYVCNKRVISFHRCKVCGCTMHWQTLGIDFGRMGVNARMLTGLDLGKIEVRAVSGPA